MGNIENVRKEIEKTYKGRCRVVEYSKKRNSSTKINERIEKVVIQNVPCRISYEKISNANSGDTNNQVTQIIKVFIAPELIIKPGSKLIITQNGRTCEYKNSGLPAIYETHQEILLEIFKGWT